MSLRLALLVCAVVSASAATAQDADSAFAAGDYAEAARLWHEDVEAGSPRAALRLAYLYDLGLGVPADRARAFRYYLVAARAGLPDAAFNIGVMLDSGVGFPRDVAAAAVWYGRAAARDHVRAQYNLGLLYAEGTGVPQNSDLARHWFERVAVALPAASERLATLPPSERAWSAPVAVAGALIDGETGLSADLVWTSPPGPVDARFEVQLLALDTSGRPIGEMTTADTQGSAVSVPIEATAESHVWRVLRIEPDARRYAASPWMRLEAEGDAPRTSALGGQVRFEIAPEDDRARALAEDLVGPLGRAGIGVLVTEADAAPEESAILYAFPQDAARADELAAFLPGLAMPARQTDEAAGAVAGEITVRLAFGPETASATREDVEFTDGG